MGLVKLDTREEGSSSPSLEYTPEFLRDLLENLELGEESLETDTVSLKGVGCICVGDSGGREIPRLRGDLRGVSYESEKELSSVSSSLSSSTPMLDMSRSEA